MFGNIKEYKIFEITKGVLEKGKWDLEEIKKENPDIVDELKDVINNKGVIFALGRKIDKKKIVKGIYIFKCKIKETEKILIFDRTLFSEVIRDEVINQFEDEVDSLLGSGISENVYSKAVFRNREFEIKKVKLGKYEISASILWICGGVVLWILTKDYIWFLFGIVFAFTFGYVTKIDGKKVSLDDHKRFQKQEKKRKTRKKRDND